MRAAIAPFVLAALVGGLFAQQHHMIFYPAAKTVPAPVARADVGRVAIGVTTLPLAQDSYKPWTKNALVTVNAFEQAIHAHAGVIMWYADWQHARAEVLKTQLDAVAKRGSTPEITWEPWDSFKPTGTAQPSYALRNIIAGKWDGYVRAWAKTLAAYGKPVRLRFAQEMNGDWYPWGVNINGNKPGEFIRAWRHVHRIFAEEHAGNVKWVWSPVAGAPRLYWPGANEVNIMGITCLNGGTTAFSTHGWRSFRQICAGSISQLHSLAPGKPIELSETGTVDRGGNPARWITSMFSFLASHPDVTSLNWFDIRKTGVDWRVQRARSIENAFIAGDRRLRH
jgi:beta-mannanase